MGKFDQSKYIIGYVKEHYERIAINVKPEIKAEIKRRAQAEGKTISAYMIDKALDKGKGTE